MLDGVPRIVGVMGLLSGLTLAGCASPPATASPEPSGAASLCQVDVRNGSDYPVEASYWLDARIPLGVLQPNQATSFAVACERESVSVGAVPPFGVSWERGRSWGSRRVTLVPGETARVVLREGGR